MKIQQAASSEDEAVAGRLKAETGASLGVASWRQAVALLFGERINTLSLSR